MSKPSAFRAKVLGNPTISSDAKLLAFVLMGKLDRYEGKNDAWFDGGDFAKVLGWLGSPDGGRPREDAAIAELVAAKLVKEFTFDQMKRKYGLAAIQQVYPEGTRILKALWIDDARKTGKVEP